MISGIEAMGKKMPVRKKPGKKISKKDNASAAAWVRIKTPIIMPMLKIANRKMAERKKNKGKLPLKGILNHTIASAGMRITFANPTRR